MNVSMSAEEREDQVAVAFRAAKPPTRVTFYIHGRTVDEYVCAGRARRCLSVCNAQAGGFLGSVRQLKRWGLDTDVASCFFSSPMEKDVFKTMSRRLEVQLQTASASKLDVALFRRLLPIVGYDHRLALFVGLPSEGDAVTLTKIRWAALTSVGVNKFVKFPDGNSIMGRENCRMMSVKHGSATPFHIFGTTWTALNLWGDVCQASRCSTAFPASQEWIEYPLTEVEIHIPSWRQIEETAKSLSTAVGIALPDSDFCNLDCLEARQLQRHLLDAYVFQLTRTIDSSRNLIDLATGTLLADNGVTERTTKAADRAGETSLFGVYSDMERMANENTVRLHDWTWIPASVVVD
jgi:hypothetical protein